MPNPFAMTESDLIHKVLKELERRHISVQYVRRVEQGGERADLPTLMVRTREAEYVAIRIFGERREVTWVERDCVAQGIYKACRSVEEVLDALNEAQQSSTIGGSDAEDKAGLGE